MSSFPEQISHAYKTLPKKLDDCLPIIDFAQPISIWDQKRWNENFAGILTIKPMWAISMMVELKLLEYRTYKFKQEFAGLPVVIKASKNITKREVKKWLQTKSIRAIFVSALADL